MYVRSALLLILIITQLKLPRRSRSRGFLIILELSKTFVETSRSRLIWFIASARVETRVVSSVGEVRDSHSQDRAACDVVDVMSDVNLATLVLLGGCNVPIILTPTNSNHGRPHQRRDSQQSLRQICSRPEHMHLSSEEQREKTQATECE